MKEFWKDLVVVELASVLAGPAVGMFFAELGAKVIKVENKNTGGDVTRSWKLAVEDPEHPISSYFCAVNAFKEHIFLDLQMSEDRILLDQLLERADILIMNFKFGDAERFNLGYDHLKAAYPKLIIGNITGFRSAPRRTAYDVVIQAECGFMSMNGNDDSGPVKMPVALMDLLAAHQLKEGILVALIQRHKKETGAWVEVSLEEAALSSLANQASNYLMNRVVATRMGTCHPNIAPYGDMFTCKDGELVVLAVGSHGQFQKMCSVLGFPDLAGDRRLRSNEARVKNRKFLQLELGKLFMEQLRDDILDRMILQGIPCGAVRRLDEVLNTDLAAKMTIEEIVDGVTTRRIASVAFRIR